MEGDWLTAEETNTLSSILNAGKKEFLAKGFRSASLRSIVRSGRNNRCFLRLL